MSKERCGEGEDEKVEVGTVGPGVGRRVGGQDDRLSVRRVVKCVVMYMYKGDDGKVCGG